MAPLCFPLLLVRAIIFVYICNHCTKTSPTDKQNIMEETQNNGEMGSSHEGEDPFNNLPDAIISTIISFLSVNEAVRTSVLSQRWRTLWKYNDHLDFNQKFMLEPVFQRWVQSRPSYSALFDAYKLILNKIGKADRLIQSIMSTHRGTLHSCRILHVMESCLDKHVERWVKYLLEEKKVKELSLACEFNRCWDVYDCECHYPTEAVRPVTLDLNFQILSRFRVLELTNYLLKTPSHFEVSHSLKTLKLKMVWLSLGMLERIISSCVSLENLSLIGCKQIKMLRIYSASIKFLELREMQVHYIDVSALNLVVLELVTMFCRANGILINAPILRVFRSYCHKNFRGKTKLRTGRLLLTIKEIVKIFTDHPSFEGPSRANIFDNLATLCIDFDLNNAREITILPSILRSCLYLQTLEINNQLTGEAERRNDSLIPYYDSKFWETRKSCDWISQGLKTVYIRGFKGKPLELRFIKHLTTRATMIDNIIICFDDDFTREGDTASMSLLSLGKASTNLSITLKPGKVYLSKVRGSMENGVSSP